VERYKEIIREKDASLGDLQATVLSKEREVIVMMHKVHYIMQHRLITVLQRMRTSRTMQWLHVARGALYCISRG
jgi:hypothetical protein